jgi:hypothetical protein
MKLWVSNDGLLLFRATMLSRLRALIFRRMKDNDERYIRKHVEESVSGIECLRKPTNNLRIAYLWVPSTWSWGSLFDRLTMLFQLWRLYGNNYLNQYKSPSTVDLLTKMWRQMRWWGDLEWRADMEGFGWRQFDVFINRLSLGETEKRTKQEVLERTKPYYLTRS